MFRLALWGLPVLALLLGCAFIRDELGLDMPEQIRENFSPLGGEHAPPPACKAMQRSCEAYRANLEMVSEEDAALLETQRRGCEEDKVACAYTRRTR